MPTDNKPLASPRKILFVGNSLSYYNGGVETHVVGLRRGAEPAENVAADLFAKGGATLKTLSDLEPLHEKIRTGGYDTVVLQEDIPETTVDDFHASVRNLAEEIRNRGAQPTLFMSWAYKRLGWVSMDQIADAHWKAARELKAKVAPVGLAMEKARAERPDMAMLGSDGEHPSIHGTYLTACVLYATLFDRDPSESGYLPARELGQVSEEDGRVLRHAAWECVQENRNRMPEDAH